MEEHVAHMRALGYRYNTNEELLLRFDRFLQLHPELSGVSLNDLVERWVEEYPSPSHLYDARRAGRVVSKAMHRLDPRVPVLSIGDGVARAARRHHLAAHLYTDEEVQRILQSALAYPSPKAPWSPIWLFTMLMLAYCAGLRGGEIARLKLGDIDLREKTIGSVSDPVRWSPTGEISRSSMRKSCIQPSFKLAEKHRQGAQVSKRYHPPQTPCERLLQAESLPEAARAKLREGWLALWTH